MAIKIYGMKLSTCTKRVLTVLYEKDIPFELIEVDLTKGAQKLPSYLKMQPFGKIPVMDDDGFVLFESRAIAKYLATKYAAQGTPLLPAAGDLKAQALVDQVSTQFRSRPTTYVVVDVSE
jgi:glutathione S-transferase